LVQDHGRIIDSTHGDILSTHDLSTMAIQVENAWRTCDTYTYGPQI